MFVDIAVAFVSTLRLTVPRMFSHLRSVVCHMQLLYFIYFMLLYIDTAHTLAQDGAILLPAAMSAKLKGQSFVRPERIQEVLEGVQNVLMQRVPDLKAVMKVTYSVWERAALRVVFFIYFC